MKECYKQRGQAGGIEDRAASEDKDQRIRERASALRMSRRLLPLRGSRGGGGGLEVSRCSMMPEGLGGACLIGLLVFASS